MAAPAPAHVLLVDPDHEYAVRFIDVAHSHFGLSAVCLYTSAPGRRAAEARWPTLRSGRVAARYTVTAAELPTFAARLRDRHDVRAVLPFVEESVLLAAVLCEALGIDWNPASRMRLFRDKAGMNAFLGERAPGLRLARSRRVRDAAEVLAAPKVPRFVLKPNAGFGNRDVRVFEAGVTSEVLSRYFARASSDVVMEAYVDGREFFVNGHVASDGRPQVVAVFEYQRASANGRRDLDVETWSVPRTDPLFEVCARYAAEVVGATGLLRSPFHLELKLDGDGPCLIEVGARLPGLGNAYECGYLHGASFDYFAIALRSYLGRDGEGPSLPLDWSTYDGRQVRYVHGLSSARATVFDVRGVDEVEALPSFSRWVKRPEVGERLRPTVDCLSMPWSVVLCADAQRDLSSDAAQVRAALRLNEGGSAGAKLTAQWTRARRRLQSLPLSGAPVARAVEEVRELVDETRSKLRRRLLQRGIGRSYDGALGRQALTPTRVQQAQQMLQWATEYLARPHPELGRSGAVCPFVHKTVQLDQFYLVFHDELDGAEPARLHDVVLSHAEAFGALAPTSREHGMFAGLMIVLPTIAEDRAHVLDDVHAELKSHLMARDLMLSPFHPWSTKPSLWNASFHVFKAPIPCLAVRHMDVRDIVFLAHNKDAFTRYHAKFRAKFERGEVDDEFGYLTAYQDARRRFGL